MWVSYFNMGHYQYNTLSHYVYDKYGVSIIKGAPVNECLWNVPTTKLCPW